MAPASSAKRPVAQHDDKERQDKDDGTSNRTVSKEEAAFILGQGGKTKAKLCAVSGAQIDLSEIRGPAGKDGSSQLQIRGSAKSRRYAWKYVDFVIAQRLGPVNIENPAAHDDLTILVVPADTVNFITGKAGSFLRLVEDEWSALLFFLQVNPKNPPKEVDPTRTERLAIFGPERRRRGAQLKVMAAIEMKLPGYFTKNVTDAESPDEGFGTDTMSIKEDDYSYALGRGGSTRKKLARASACIVEYVGRVAYFCGIKKERSRAKEYLQWLLRQRVGEHVHVEQAGRDDVSVIQVPSSCIGFVTGHKGSSLRAIEEETATFCFIEGTVDDGGEQKPLLVFGVEKDRRVAESLVWEKISMKIDEVAHDYGSHNRHSKGKGKSRDDGKGDRGKGRNGKAEKGKGDKENGNGTAATKNGWYARENHQSTVTEEQSESGGGVPGSHAVNQDSNGLSYDSRAITDDDAAFLMGPGGRTKKKIAAVSGAELELKTNRLDITGTEEARKKARKYIDLVMAQRIGPVRLDDTSQHDDLSIIEVPAEAVSFVTGKQGSFLRLVEEEFGTLLFFIDFNMSHKRDQVERLAIFGQLRGRRGAELKVMAAIEMKTPGYFTKAAERLPPQDTTDGFATDRMVIDEADYSYALGKGGATRKKIARASGCVIEYIGRLAYLSGQKKERVRAREYLGWLFCQRVGPVEVDYEHRDDVTVMQVPKDCVGFVTGHKGTALRAVEDATGTFCFIEGGREDPHRDPKPLLVFGYPEARKDAEERIRRRIEQKVTEGWVHEDYGGGYGYGYGHGYGGYNDGGKGRSGPKGKAPRGKQNDDGGSYASPEVGAEEKVQAQQAGEPEDEGAWGDWGGDSEGSDAEGAQAAAAGKASSGGATAAEVIAAARASNAQLLGATGKWSSGHVPASYSGSGLSGSGHPGVGGYSPQRHTGHATGYGASPSTRGGEELDLPPQLLHEEAWPELGPMGAGGGPKKGRK